MKTINPLKKIDFKPFWKRCNTPFGEGYELTEDIKVIYHKPFSDCPVFEVRDGKDYSYNRFDMTINNGYQWDGSSGAFDTENAMLASLIHDVFCVDSHKTGVKTRKFADDLFYKILKAQGVNKFRAWYHWIAVSAYRIFKF